VIYDNCHLNFSQLPVFSIFNAIIPVLSLLNITLLFIKTTAMYAYRILFILIIVLFGGCSKESQSEEKNTEQDNPIYLDENGVTIKCNDWGKVGDIGNVGGVTYTIVDESLLRQMVNNAEDVTKVCTTKVTDMSKLFFDAPFNQDISSWDVSNVTDMSEMFRESLFNQYIDHWDVGNVATMATMFGYSPFNQDIGSWDVGNVIDMNSMFVLSLFNQDIGSWDVSNVTIMYRMFRLSTFNQDIGSWDVSNVTSMASMFSESSFNQDISSWDVSNVTSMGSMFFISPFNQDLSGWNVDNVIDCFWFSLYTESTWLLPKPNFTNCTP
jgi:surface protein